MKRRLVVLLGLALAGAAWAQGTTPATPAVPDVRGMEAYSPQSRYMSLEGYLRWAYFQQNNRWLTWDEAAALVDNQVRVAAAPSSLPPR